MKIALIGNANCGKTTLFNLLTKSNEATGNRAGVTFGAKEAPLKSKKYTAEIVDLPGIYSLTSQKAEEKAALDYLRRGDCDVIVDIIDASNLSRGLFLTLQLIREFPHVTVALNMMDEAERDGTKIDIAGLSEKLGVPVFPISAAKKRGIDELISSLFERMPESVAEKCDFPESALASLALQIASESAVYSRLLGKNTDRIDRLICKKYIGIPLFFAVMLASFYLSFSWLGEIAERYFSIGLDKLASELIALFSRFGASVFMLEFIENGICRGIAAVLSFLPQTAVLFFILELFEESGYTARASFVMDGAMRKLGLSGKAFIPALLGFGCTVPAIMSTQTLDISERRRAVYSLAFIPCSARFPIVIAISSAFFPKRAALIAFSLYLAGIFAFVLSCLLFSGKGGTAPDVVYELPRFRMPNGRNVFRSVKSKILQFATRSGSIVFLSSALIYILCSLDTHFRYTASAGESLLCAISGFGSFILKPLGLDDYRISAALISGFFAKESIVSTMSVLFGEGFRTALSPAAAYTFAVLCMTYTPCAATVAAARAELGKKDAFFMILRTFAISFLLSFVVYTLSLLLL